MIDVTVLREKPEEVKEGLTKKSRDPKLLDRFLALDESWRSLTKKIDEARHALNNLSKERKIEEAKKTKEEIKKLEAEIKDIETNRAALLEQFPNIPFKNVPVGKDESENKVLREVGEKPEFGGFTPKDYLKLGADLNIVDVERASKVSGSRFGYLKNEAVLLEFALTQYVMETLIKEGFSPIIPPVMVKPEILKGMGKVKFIEDGDAFFIPSDNLYLAGSSEQTIGPMHADEIFEEKELPKRYVGFSTCFRREAGSYGKDTKGILRVHQFDKIEMFSFVKPENSEKEHEFLLSLQEKLMQGLKLPYRVMEICTGDMGFGDARQFDIETWIPSENRYRETQSTSNTTDYQARGVNIKYRGGKEKSEYVHMLNGTAFAIGRILIAIIENYQTKEGTIKIPEVLAKYVGTNEIKKK